MKIPGKVLVSEKINEYQRQCGKVNLKETHFENACTVDVHLVILFGQSVTIFNAYLFCHYL
jgi:hypothetical protein